MKKAPCFANKHTKHSQLSRSQKARIQSYAQTGPRNIISYYVTHTLCLQCFDAVGLDGRKGIRPVKTEWWGAGMVICLERGADSQVAQLMPLPLAVSCFSKIQIGFTFLVPAHVGKKVKFSHTRYRALGPELIPVYRQSARR